MRRNDCAADVVFRGGRVLTVDRDFTVASAVAVTGERIRAVGSDESVGELIGPDTRVIELGGRAVLPGINDAHLHLALFGLSSPPFSVDLSGVRSVAALGEALTKGSAGLADGEWLIGGGWRETTIAEFAPGARGPHREHLDAVTGPRPAVLNHVSLHSVLANTAALRVAGIDRDTADPAGGRIVRDADGEPTGLLLESAAGLVTRHRPRLPERRRLDAIASAMRTLNALGITSVTDPVVWPELLRDYLSLHREDRMTVRVNTLLHWDWPSPSTSSDGIRTALGYAGLSSGLGDDWLRVGGVKLFADGVPGNRTAWLNQPYPEGGSGGLVTAGATEEARYAELLDIIDQVHRHRLQIQIHVTGDRAADAAIDGIVRAQRADPWPRARHALIHGTLLSEESLPRLAEYGIGVITSSLMKTYTRASMEPVIGADRWERTFPAAALLAAGVAVADSSDAPCFFPDWRRGLATFAGAGFPGRNGETAVLPPERRLGREQAIRLWTGAGAYFEHAEDRKGALQRGKLADLVVLAQDPLTTDPESLPGLTPVLTMVGGRIVFDAAAPG
ncbi:amidohydrolase [Amycolatopsis anabasis]|uniref:amidohydrolase n=1 Tax=Amycolatopsis anabasis TaxID=1840409 RepID=UPI00131A7E1B|nr:amidohydrolase [Amycolatopsis anabasis]